MCRNFCDCSTIARTTSGCEWPVEFTAMPAAQSRKRLPSTSSTVDPLPRSMTSGYPRVYEGETTARSRSMSALAFGPGSGVLMCGASGICVRGPQRAALRSLRHSRPSKGRATFVGALLSFPARARRAVLEQHAAGGEILPNPIGGSEVAPASGGVPVLDEPFDLVDGHR